MDKVVNHGGTLARLVLRGASACQPLTTPTTGRSTTHSSGGSFRSGSTRLGFQKDGLPSAADTCSSVQGH